MKLILQICSILLIVALFDMPIGYYTFLRIVVTIGAIAVLVNEFAGEINARIVVWGILAVLFNPIIPIYLHDKEIWAPIDLIAALLFEWKFLQLFIKKEKQ